MTHAHTLKLVPADLDRLHRALARAGVVAETPYLFPFELLAAIEHLAVRAGRAPRRGPDDAVLRSAD